MISNRKVLEVLCNLSVCASKDEIRHSLQSVNIVLDDKCCIFTACDGCKLIHSYIINDDFLSILKSYSRNEYFNISTIELKRLKSFLKSNKTGDISLNLIDNCLNIDINKSSITININNLTYPNTNFFNDLKSENINSIKFNPIYLSNICDAISGFFLGKKKIESIQLDFSGKLAPIEINIEHQEIKYKAFLMPKE